MAHRLRATLEPFPVEPPSVTPGPRVVAVAPAAAGGRRGRHCGRCGSGDRRDAAVDPPVRSTGA